MTNPHPLTEKDCFDIQWDPQANYQDEVDLIRAGYDKGAADKLEQVNKFFDTYRKTIMEVNPGYIPSLTELLSLMNHAMRPHQQQQQEDQ